MNSSLAATIDSLVRTPAGRFHMQYVGWCITELGKVQITKVPGTVGWVQTSM